MIADNYQCMTMKYTKRFIPEEKGSEHLHVLRANELVFWL